MSKTIITKTKVVETDVVDKIVAPKPEPKPEPKPKKFSFDSMEEAKSWFNEQKKLEEMYANYPRLAKEEKEKKEKEKEKEKEKDKAKKEKEKEIEKAKRNALTLFLVTMIFILGFLLITPNLTANIKKNFSNQDDLVPIGITYYSDAD